jgi:hypothetical protein
MLADALTRVIYVNLNYNPAKFVLGCVSGELNPGKIGVQTTQGTECSFE